MEMAEFVEVPSDGGGSSLKIVMKNLHKLRSRGRRRSSCLLGPTSPLSQQPNCHKIHQFCPKIHPPPSKLQRQKPTKTVAAALKTQHLKPCQTSYHHHLYFYAFVALISPLLLINEHQADIDSNTDNHQLNQLPQFSSDSNQRPPTAWTLPFVQGAQAAETYILRDHQKLSPKSGNSSSNKSPTKQEISPTSSTTNTNHPRQAAKVISSNRQLPVATRLAGAGQLAKGPANSGGSSRRPTSKSAHHLVQSQQQQQFDPDFADGQLSAGLQISITPRNGQIRVPVGENTILKCLISSQVNKFTRKFDVHWSRYMYDENVYEQLETGSAGFELVGAQLNNNNHDENTGDELNNVPVVNSTRANGNNLLDLDNNSRQQQPFNRQQQLRDFLSRSRQETNPISDLLIEATLTISPVKASDNATYYCRASDGLGSAPTGHHQQEDRARIDLVALSKPVVRLERAQPARDSKSAIVHWLILSDGNTPIKRTILMVRNDSHHQHQQQQAPAVAQQEESLDQSGFHQSVSPSTSVVVDSDNHQWQRIDIPGDGESPAPMGGFQAEDETRGLSGLLPEDSVVRADVDVTSLGGGSSSGEDHLSPQSRRRPPADWQLAGKFRAGSRQRRSFNLTALLPGVTYNLRLAAINDMGQSNWTHLSATMPNEIPAQIGEVFLLSRSNDSLAIGWKRPAYDGAKTIRYEMQLFDLNRTLTLDANTNTTTGSGPSTSAGAGPHQAPSRTNFMYIFVNLNPGTDYHFHVRACSRAGCSAFSSPKLLASTMDGEPDEPVDVELSCQLEQQPASGGSSQSSGNVSISWLPPVNTRGQLTNYSVHLESYAKYVNQSGQWQVDEWRSTMETPNNHTLSLEMGGLLAPNTNYSVRVCANNRSKHCGRLSAVSARAQCSTPPELPQQLPAGLRLSLANLSADAVQVAAGQPTTGDQLESLVLDLPPISRRNGSIDCVQIVLIRLPDSYSTITNQNELDGKGAGNGKFLDQFLPREPSDIRLVPYADLRQQPASDNIDEGDQIKDASASDQKAQRKKTQQEALNDNNDQRALAYLAEEISGDNEEQQVATVGGLRRIILGDGQSESCQKLPHAAPAELRPFDGGLRALTYYTGFIRLLLIRHNSQSKRTEIVAKHSGYFEPVKTGTFVIKIPAPKDEHSLVSSSDQESLFSTFNLSNLTSVPNLREFVSRLGSTVGSNAIKLYHHGSSYLASNLRLEAVSNYIMRSSPQMQLLQVGTLVLGLSLSLLLVIYLISLPNSILRKRKRKLKRQLQKHQEMASANNLQQQPQPPPAQDPLQLGQLPSCYEPQQEVNNGYTATSSQQSETVNLQSNPSIRYRSQTNEDGGNLHQPPVGYGTTTVAPQSLNHDQCPIHSSPMARNQRDNFEGQTSASRRPSVHVCHPISSDGYATSQADFGTQHAHHHHHHHHGQQQQLIGPANQIGHANQDFLARQQQQPLDQYERNCRTTSRRLQTTNGFASANDYRLINSGTGNTLGQNSQQTSAAARNFTLNHHNSVLALAKKINKSIPLSLFGPVLECRLRNNWLREEYEQLPRQQQFILDNNTESKNLLLLRLRPQLIVSRNDTVSALISGNDLFDASLIRSGPVNNNQLATNSANLMPEKRIICAKSPLDADSVWDFWRLVYEQDVSTMVMLTQTEDQQTGDIRCAQYWPTCDNEETTILSPCNEHVQKSTILPAKFKIRQETLEDESSVDDFMVRRLTFMVMATKPGENEQTNEPETRAGDTQQQTDETRGEDSPAQPEVDGQAAAAAEEEEAGNEEELIIVERTILHLQYNYWNTSSLANQMRLIKFIEMANERHSRAQLEQQDSPLDPVNNHNNHMSHHQRATMLVHCFNGLGRSGLFTAMSFVIDELSFKLGQQQQQTAARDQQQQQPSPKVNIFQLVSRLRSQREMLLSPYRLYELLYQLTLNCIPSPQDYSSYLHHHHHHDQHPKHDQLLQLQQQQYQHHHANNN